MEIRDQEQFHKMSIEELWDLHTLVIRWPLRLIGLMPIEAGISVL